MTGTAMSGTPLTPAPLSGGRRRSHKKLRMVKKKTVRKMLKKMGLKMRGGAAGEVTGDKVVTDPKATGAVVPSGGRRGKSHGKTHKRRGKSFLGMRF
jgi:hypothetical protein